MPRHNICRPADIYCTFWKAVEGKEKGYNALWQVHLALCGRGTEAHTVNATPLPGDAVPFNGFDTRAWSCLPFPLIKLDSKSTLCPVLIRYYPIIWLLFPSQLVDFDGKIQEFTYLQVHNLWITQEPFQSQVCQDHIGLLKRLVFGPFKYPCILHVYCCPCSKQLFH